MPITSETMVKMSDGTGLYTAAILPAEGRWPVILIREPYQSEGCTLETMTDYGTAYAEAGYATVVQLCRGTAKSEGDFIPFENERSDGLETLDWIRAQPFYNGEIYLFGTSYRTAVHLSYLDTHPTDVKGAALEVMTANRYNMTYLNGYLRGTLAAGWYLEQYKKKTLKRHDTDGSLFSHFPLSEMTSMVYGEPAKAVDELLLHPYEDDPFWNKPGRRSLADSNIPILLIGGTYDVFFDGMLKDWNEINPGNRSRCAFIASGYAHGRDYSEASGETPLRFPEGGVRECFPRFELDWFDNIRNGTPLPEGIVPGNCTYYSIYENRWHIAPTIYEGENPLKLYLGRGVLSETPTETGEMTYTYNPRFPASFKGGACHNFGGMQKQDPPGLRQDILNFISEPFEADTVISGSSEVVLHVRTDGEDTCFYVHLSVVDENGDAWSLRNDILTLRDCVKDYRPNDEAKMEFSLSPHAYMIKKDWRLRLDVSSSDYPNFNLHSNYPGNQFFISKTRTAHNTVILGKSHIVMHTV